MVWNVIKASVWNRDGWSPDAMDCKQIRLRKKYDRRFLDEMRPLRSFPPITRLIAEFRTRSERHTKVTPVSGWLMFEYSFLNPTLPAAIERFALHNLEVIHSTRPIREISLLQVSVR